MRAPRAVAAAEGEGEGAGAARRGGPRRAIGGPGYESSEVGETARAFASDSSVSSGGVRCPRSSMEM